MAQVDLIVGRCPQCGEQLEIPSHLKQFSCLYCGARLSPAELVVDQPQPAAVDVDAVAAGQYYRDHILEAIVAHRGIEQSLTKADFEPAFDRYSAATGKIFRQLDDAVSAGALSVEDAAEEFLNQLEENWRSSSKRGSFAMSVQDRDKFILAIFLVPMVRRMGLSCGEAYCQALRSAWMRRYPKSVFNLGDYDTIVAGFRKKYLGLCFITTAVCRGTGKSDTCDELTAFRNFRDGYLRACPDGPDLIDEYYDIAPAIVLRLDLSTDRDRHYEALRQDYLLPCYQDIQAGRLEKCKERYVAMMRALEAEYLS